MTIVRKLKKSLLIVCLILLTCLVVPLKGVFAAGNATLTIETIDAENGEEVKLAVTLSNNPGICTFRLAINYDKELTLIGVSDTKLYGDHMFGNDLNANPYILMWDESLKTKSNKSEGVLAYLTFRVDKDAASGTHKVWITYNTGDIYDLDLKDIDVQLVEGGVTVKNASVTAIPTNIATSTLIPEPTSTLTPAPTCTSTPVPTGTLMPVYTGMPTQVPTSTPAPHGTTSVPTPVPTSVQTPVPTSTPTYVPTSVPTPVPTSIQTPMPTSTPTHVPTSVPTPVPTSVPTPVPTSSPTHVPTSTLTPVPTIIPTNSPTIMVTDSPTIVVTGTTTPQPSVTDSVTPTEVEIPKVTDTPLNIKPFTVTITDEYDQTVKYKIIPENDKTGIVAGKATIVSLKASKKSIIIPDSVEIDGKRYNVTAIGKNALKADKKATKLQIGANVTTISNNAFKGLKKLKTITINSRKITEVRTGAFSGIAKKATISIKANKTAYKNIVSLIKGSGIGKKVTFKRIK